MKHRLTAGLVFIFMAGAFGQETSLIKPFDISSPRATLNSFEKAYFLLEERGLDLEGSDRQEGEVAIRGTSRCLDVSQVAEFSRDHMPMRLTAGFWAPLKFMGSSLLCLRFRLG